MTKPGKKEFLKQYRESEQEIRQLQLELARLEREGQEARAKQVRAQLAKQVEQTLPQRREIDGAVAVLQDARQRVLMYLRYLDGLTWEQVAQRMQYGKRQIYNLHVRAVEGVNIALFCTPAP